MTYLRIAWGKVKCRFGWHQWETADFYDDEHFPYPRMVASRRCKRCPYQTVTKY